MVVFSVFLFLLAAAVQIGDQSSLSTLCSPLAAEKVMRATVSGIAEVVAYYPFPLNKSCSNMGLKSSELFFNHHKIWRFHRSESTLARGLGRWVSWDLKHASFSNFLAPDLTRISSCTFLVLQSLDLPQIILFAWRFNLVLHCSVDLIERVSMKPENLVHCLFLASISIYLGDVFSALFVHPGGTDLICHKCCKFADFPFNLPMGDPHRGTGSWQFYSYGGRIASSVLWTLLVEGANRLHQAQEDEQDPWHWWSNLQPPVVEALVPRQAPVSRWRPVCVVSSAATQALVGDGVRTRTRVNPRQSTRRVCCSNSR